MANRPTPPGPCPYCRCTALEPSYSEHETAWHCQGCGTVAWTVQDDV